MTSEQALLLVRADRALQTARIDLDAGDGVAATNRAYYAAFYAARAVLLSFEEAPRTHSGVHRRFGVHVVESKRMDARVASTLVFAFRARQSADYDTFAVADDRAVADLILDAEAFVAAVRPLVRPPDSPPLP